METLEPYVAKTRDRRVLGPWVQSLIYLDRVKEARPALAQLATMGYRGTELVSLCRRKGIMELEGQGPS